MAKTLMALAAGAVLIWLVLRHKASAAATPTGAVPYLGVADLPPNFIAPPTTPAAMVSTGIAAVYGANAAIVVPPSTPTPAATSTTARLSACQAGGGRWAVAALPNGAFDGSTGVCLGGTAATPPSLLTLDGVYYNGPGSVLAI